MQKLLHDVGSCRARSLKMYPQLHIPAIRIEGCLCELELVDGYAVIPTVAFKRDREVSCSVSLEDRLENNLNKRTDGAAALPI